MATDDPILFGTWLKKRREALDLTQKELAAETGCSLSTVRKMEAGLRRPSKQVAELLAAKFQITAEDYSAFMRFAREGGEPQAMISPSALPELSEAQPPAAEEIPAPEGADRATVQEPQTTKWQPEASHVAVPPNNIPYYPTSFIGRERVVETVLGLLWRVDVRLLTLTGPPGMGKTRLAVESAAQLLQDFSGGVYLIPLAPISDPMMVLPAVAAVLGVRPQKGTTLISSLIEFLGQKNVLLLFDNFEQVVEGATVVADLLRGAPRLKVLATSRVPLNLYGEHEFAVPPLDLPQGDSGVSAQQLGAYSAVQLFMRRAQAVKPEFDLTSANAGVVNETVRRLEGLPLAIELAAARLKYYEPSAMLALLQHRLGVLTGGPRDLPARHRTLRAAIAWSYDLLSPLERTLFRTLGVFSDGFTREAAEAVFATPASSGDGEPVTVEYLIVSLVDKSLVSNSGDAESRFTMLETIREYALEQLTMAGEEDATRSRHARYFADFVRQANKASRGDDYVRWLVRQDHDHNNIRAALTWLVESGHDRTTSAETALDMVRATYDYWDARGFFNEGRAWFGAALDNARALGLFNGAPEVRLLVAKTLNSAGLLAWSQSDSAAATPYYEQALAIFRELEHQPGKAGVINNLALLAMDKADFAAARELYSESLEMARAAHDTEFIALSLNNLGVTLWDAGDVAGAKPLFAESEALYREIGQRYGLTLALDNLGLIAIKENDFAAAHRYQEEALAICRELDHKNSIAHVLANIGMRLVDERNFAAAAPYLNEALTLSWRIGYARVTVKALESIANLLAESERELQAAQLWGTAEAMRENFNNPRSLPGMEQYKRRIANAESRRGQVAFQSAWRTGRNMTTEDAADLALRLLAEEEIRARHRSR